MSPFDRNDSLTRIRKMGELVVPLTHRVSLQLKRHPLPLGEGLLCRRILQVFALPLL